MGSTHGYASCYISINLSVSLSSFKVKTLLLSILLVPQSLPLRKPSLWVWLLSWVLGIEVLRVSGLSLTLLWKKDLSSSFCLLDHILCLLFFLLLWHAIFNKLSEILIVISNIR